MNKKLVALVSVLYPMWGLLLCPLMAQGPNVVTLAGYTAPQPLKVAPGQIIALFVRASSIALTDPMTANGLPLPFNLGGFSVTLRQTFSDVVPVPIRSVYPVQNCSTIATLTACASLTGITVQIPFELVPNVDLSRMPENFASLTVSENGMDGDPLAVEPVGERLHIVNTCDATEAVPPPAVCHPIIRHADASIVSADNPAHPDEVLTIGAYGLGRVSTSVGTGSISPDPPGIVSETRIGLLFGANLNPSVPGSDTPLSAVLTPGAVGLYGIAFKVPALPDATPACDNTVQSNLTVTIARGNSFDGVGLCVN
jgi:uncharacterized protein (TIGR03437 family)